MVGKEVCAVIATFNRKKVLLKCLSALLDQTYPLNSIFIIDGPSTDGTEKALLAHGFIKDLPPPYSKNGIWWTENIVIHGGKRIDLYYIRIYDDIGGSGSFHEGLRRAYNDGYDYIWVMDDDVIPLPTALENLIKALKAGYEAARPALVDIKDFSPWFAGGLFSRSVIKKVGLPLKEFFIYWDDVEYVARCQRSGIKMIDVPNAKVHHKDWLHRGVKCRVLLGRRFVRPIYPLGRKYYYIQRNKLYFYLMHRRLKALMRSLTIELIDDLVTYLILKDVDKVLSIIRGTIDAFLRKTGKSAWAHEH